MGTGSSRRRSLPKSLVRGWKSTYEKTPYRDLPWFSPTPYPWVREVARTGGFRGGGRLLDVGCGAGTNSLFLARSGFEVSGIDLAPGAVRAADQRARRARLSIDFRVGDALQLPFPKGRFDGAIDVGCFHTLPIDLRADYARELARVLRKGARYALSWVAREYTRNFGPPHRPSVEEVARAFEPSFLMLRTEFHSAWGSLPSYSALMERRRTPQPPSR
ncbi:MAG TPA: class I SAM-dependent methyltransferase [Thermoplasmata archaeon]|nr:class I SAM-dependent methyltransferase [Thermoplasmata archaeon]HEV2428386.1 class I SAM-dependent methyltransferase [Thermoplasmata archaeon]